MVDDDELDLIYVATPDNMHHEHALLGLASYPFALLPKLPGPAKKNGRAETG
ncbi:hypothetical protein H4P12_00255 [Paracoccus sp. 11-3]|uniref:Oxidoreductase family, NAD-binding Rossmann fold n=1 Tax=Paracoccus amoyensis TaxID=2760093 RepID=A0A926GB69_9RHOB|nr:hypothetical protein [Paracoccus amoyensis]MBC9245176.1 hypothetical protein [Paracoccus amoyensis]